jgi:hypothetical protein
MKKIWDIKLEMFKASFSKHLKQNTTVLGFEIKFFSHCFVAFRVQKMSCKSPIGAPIGF